MFRKYFFLFFAFFSYLPVLAQVDSAWVRRYNGPGNGNDQQHFSIYEPFLKGRYLALDTSGNVHVTGTSWNGASLDYVTIKYASNGDTLWLRRLDHPGANPRDRASAITVDSSGNVYVTGGTDAAGYATIKYTSIGDTLWVSRYSGGRGGFATDLDVDADGNVYVTGYVEVLRPIYGAHFDYTTIKYNPDGETLWVRSFDHLGYNDIPYAIDIDDSGNVYVTGRSYVDPYYSDIATIKYSPGGDVVWVRRYGDPGLQDEPATLAVDHNGDLYVVGSSISDMVTLKYAPNGDTLWVRRYHNGRAYDLAIDESGNVYVTGSSNWDYTTIKYTPDGDTLWVRNYAKPENDEAFALAIDKQGNAYVTGYFTIATTHYTYATIKYSSFGDIQWVKTYNGPSTADYAIDVALDQMGNVYVTGWSVGCGTGTDFLTIKNNAVEECAAVAGDFNADCGVNLSDIISKVNYVFKDGAPPDLSCRGDDNADGKISLIDIIYNVNFVFKGGPSPLQSDICCL